MDWTADPFECLAKRTDPLTRCRLLDERNNFMSKLRGRTPSHSTDKSCAGKSLLEIMWDELDQVVDRIMTEEEREDGRDPGRAEGMAWLIAIVQNPYLPNLSAVREEATRRFEEGEVE